MAKSKKMIITLPHEGYEALEKLSEQERRPVAELVRQALEDFTEKYGIKANFRVEWGGNRAKTQTDQKD